LPKREDLTSETSRLSTPIVSPMSRRPVIQYRRAFEFASTPQELWDAIQEVDRFEAWWPWLEEFRLEGDALQAGSVLYGVVAPPLPYRMRIQVELTHSEAPREIDALIHGDLEGVARIEIRPSGAGSTAEVAWTVEMMQRPMRLACRFGRPLLQWGHDRVVESTVAGFRRRLESGDT
jgi:carbon monoxide dehydrogenase subunit G